MLPRPPPASTGDAEQVQAHHVSSIVDGERRESRNVEEDCGGTPNMKQARSNATNSKRWTASSLPPNNFIGSDEHSADAPHYTTASSLGADQLLSAFYRYHFFFTAIPLIFALVHTSFRGEGDLCVFDGVSLGVYLSGVRGAGGASAVFDERTDQQREFGVPLDAAWVTAEWLLPSIVQTAGGWWLLNAISGAVHVEEQEEAKTVASGVFASFLVCFIAPYYLVAGGGSYLTLSAEDPEKRSFLRVIWFLLFPLLFLVWIAGERVRHRCAAWKQPRRGRAIFCVAKFVFTYILWGLLTLMFGIQFVVTLLPAVLRSVQDWPPLWKSAVELLATGSYFILWIPLMEKAGGKILLPMVLPQRHDFDFQRVGRRRPQTHPQSLDSVFPHSTTTASTHSEHASDFFSRDEKIASTLRRRKDGFQFLLQNCFDVLRFVFGRGVLSQLSPFTFAAMLMYDVIYHFWHFALRQQESLLVFSIRVTRATWSGFEYGSPNSFESRLFRLMWGLQQLTQPLRKLAVAFEEKYDFLADERARQAFYSGDTGYDTQSVWFSFCNVRLVVENVPTELLRSVCCPVALPVAEGGFVLGPAQRTNQTHQSSSRDARSAHHEVTDSTKAAAAPVGRISSSCVAAHEGQGGTLLDCEANDQIAPGRADVTPATSAARTAPKERLSTADAVTSTVSTTSCQSAHTFVEIAKQLSVHVNRSVSMIRSQRAGFGKMLASFFPSVTCEDSERLEGFVRFFRQKNFVRYQIRAQVRILVSLVMISVPLASRVGNVYYYAGFPQDDSTWMKLIAASLVFLAKDLLEWYVITFKFMLCSEWRIEQFVPALFNESSNPGFEYRRYTYDGMAQAVAMGVLGTTAYMCAAMYALRWNAYNMFEIQTVTGHRDLEWKEVYGFCKEGGVA